MTTQTDASAPAASVERWVEAFIEGWRAPAGPDEFADFFEPHLIDDVRMIQPQLPTLVGKRAFREGFVRPTFTLIPDLHATVHDWAATAEPVGAKRSPAAPEAASPGDALVYINFTLQGTLGGKPISWPCIDRIVLRDGLCAERRAHFDPTPLLAAAATRPRAWPTFLRVQVNRLRGAS